MVVTSLYDTVATRYLGLVLHNNEQEAIRSFHNEMASAYGNTNSLLFTNYGDFDLHRLGDFDTDTGVLNPCNPVVIAKGSQIFAIVDGGEQDGD